MCELLGISASAPFTPADAMRTFRLRGGQSADNPDGWGIAYREEAAFRLFKAPEPAAWQQTFATISELVAAHGKFNFLMPDGEHLIAYGHDRLHYLERHGKDGQKMDWPEDSALVATQPLDDDGGWIAFERGELRLYRLGTLIGRILTDPGPAANRDRAAVPALQ